MGKTDANGVDLYDGGTGDIRPWLSVSDMREDCTGLSVLVGGGIEESKAFEVLVLFSCLFTKVLRFACAGSCFKAGRSNRDELSSSEI